MNNSHDIDKDALLQDALSQLEKMDEKLSSISYKKREPIAIVGMSCRVAGANSIGEFWNILHDGKHRCIFWPDGNTSL